MKLLSEYVHAHFQYPNDGAVLYPSAVYLPSDKPPLFDDSEASVQIKTNMTAVLECSAESVGPTSYLWYQNEDLITNTSKITISPSGNMLTIAHCQYSDAGIYICRAIDLLHHSNKTWDLTVFGKGEITFHTE